MTLQTSLFNRGIYKSTLRRFFWGSIAYFILLFISTCMIILLTLDKDNSYWYMAENGSYLLSQGFLNFSMIVAIAVPTVTALLVYRFVHSKRLSIFVHSLPVSRNANYISSFAAGLTLMAVPIILNGIALMILSATGYSLFFDINSCLIWTVLNLLGVFVMFSYASFCAMITGNSFAFVGLNVLIHCFIPLIVASFGLFSECFLYGYANDNVILNFVSDNNPVMWLSSLVSRVSRSVSVDISKIVWQIIIAIVLYALALVLYKKRRIETAEEVAAFKCLNPIYKYFITFICALVTFAILGDMTKNSPHWVLLIVAIISFVVYFAAEMLLKKTFKVWKKAYKGFICFTAGMAVIFGVFSLTSFFGFETYVPKAEKLESVALYNYYHQTDEPFVTNKEITDFILKTHTELTQTVPQNVFAQNVYRYEENFTRLHVAYKLKNGRRVNRVYNVPMDRCHEVMSVLYKYEEYKKACEQIFDDDIEKFYEIRINHNEVEIISNEASTQELTECLRKDILALDYDQMYTDGSAWNRNIGIEYQSKKDAEVEKLSPNPNSRAIRYMDIPINANFKNTINWIKANGYWDYLKLNNSPEYVYYICTNEDFQSMSEAVDNDNNNHMREASYTHKNYTPPENAIKIDTAKNEELLDFIHNYPVRYVYGDDFYVIGRSNTDKEYFDVITNLDNEAAKQFMIDFGITVQ